MEGLDLVALLPVDREMAVKKRWVGMPLPALLGRLQEGARGRGLYLDEKVPARPAGTNAGLRDEILPRMKETELYFDYAVNGRARKHG